MQSKQRALYYTSSSYVDKKILAAELNKEKRCSMQSETPKIWYDIFANTTIKRSYVIIKK